jgi:hypothetical protein
VQSRDDEAGGSGVGRLRGQCCCGEVAYVVDDCFLYALNCHCSQCRAATGSAFKPLAGIDPEHFRLSRGRDSLLIYGEAGEHDARCARCGSLLYSLVLEGSRIHVALGSLRDTPSISPQAHIFVGSKAPWYEITDGLPQYEEYQRTAPHQEDRQDD